MSLTNTVAQYRVRQRGVVHATLNPEGPGAVRIHLVPPRWRPFRQPTYTVLLNGYYLLPLGYSWAVLLARFIEEVDRYEGRPMTETDMGRVMEEAVRRTRLVYPEASAAVLSGDLRELLDVLFAVARGETPDSPIGVLSLREYAREMAAPHRMDLLVSAMTDGEGRWNCNLKCRHCYAAGQPSAGGRELSTAEWKAVIDRCRKAGIPQLTFTGGEPTRRADLPELIAHARWFVTRLNTNGMLLTPELCAALRQASLDSVQITLYAADPARHDKLVGTAGGWEGTTAGLRAALEAGLNCSVNTPLCRDNAAYTETLRYLQTQGVRYVTCSGLIETGRAADGAPSSQLSVEEMDGILREAAAFCAANGMELSFTSPGRAHPAVLRELGLTVPACGACLSNMAVSPDGTAVPCQSWLNGSASLGHMLRDPWRRIWNHPLAHSLRAMSEEDALCCPLRVSKREGGGAHG